MKLKKRSMIIVAVVIGFAIATMMTVLACSLVPGYIMFTEINPDSLTAVANSATALGDIDGDGDLDLILTGYANSSIGKISKIYQNNGKGFFTEINSGSLIKVSSGSIKLGDINGDGDLDLILTGSIDTSDIDANISKIYTNNGSGGFTEINSGSLAGVSYSSIDLGDIDGDGDLDLILTGRQNTRIYQNDGNGSFTEINVDSLPRISSSSIALRDIDGDGDLDLILTGRGYDGSSYYMSKIYQNNGSGFFSEINSGSLTGVYRSSIKLGDIDGDGDIDLIVTGYYYDNGHNNVSKIYQNNGSGSFTEINLNSLKGVEYGSIALGDLDGDSDLDLILTGDGEAKIYQNDGSGAFTEINWGSLTGVEYGSVALGDIDGDGDLDLILSGDTDKDIYHTPVSKIYRNDTK